jgi:hypothetical protein
VSTERIRELRSRARRARELAFSVTDKQVGANLHRYATDLQAEASRLEVEIVASAAMNAASQEPGTGPEAAAAMKPKTNG